MVQKKPPVPARAKTNHSAHLSTKLAISSSSVLLKSAFSPSYLRISLFASTILGLDAQRLRIHDTATARLRYEHTFEKGVSVNSLAWGSLPTSDDRATAKKKRKRISTANGDNAAGLTAVIAIATNKSSILLFSPSEGTVVGTLEGGHIGEVRQFVFSGEAEEGKGWSCGTDGKLVEWDLRRKITLRTINLPDSSIQRLAYTPPTVLCASHTVYAIPFANPGMAPAATFSANTSTIHSLFASADNTHFLSGADSDRFINVFSVAGQKSIGALVTESDVKTIALGDDNVLAAVTIDGVVEVFRTPFEPVPTQSAEVSRRRKTITRKGDAKIKIVRPDSTERVSIADASLQGEDLVIAWTESGVNMQFEKFRWSSPEDGSLVLNGLVEITRDKAAGIGGSSSAMMNGAKDMGKVSVDSSKTVVISGVDTQDIGMADASDVSSDEEEQTDDTDDDDEEDDEKEAEEPSFAEKFQALEVSSAVKTATSAALATTSSALAKRGTQPPSAGSLSTVLTQALKTNDTGLLESCLHTTDSNSILTTVRRLSATMAVTLLERLAERIARRPGRAGSLGIWVRWTLVAHGGYLVSLPDLMSTLSGLYSTLNTRAGALPKLLALQGRLDMLHAQVDLRKALRNTAEGGLGGDGGGDKGVLYVEGQEQDSSSDYEVEDEDEEEEEPEEVGMQGLQIEDASFIKSGASDDTEEDEDMDSGAEGSSEEGDEDADEDEDDDDEDNDDDGDDEEVNGFLDIEASEASGEEEEEEVDYDDVDVGIVDTDEDEDEDVRVGPKSKSKLLQGRSRR